MTEMETYRPTAPVVTTADPTGGRLVAWADGLAAAHRIGTALCSTAFVPTHFKGKPEEAAAAILFGDEIGLSPTQALRSVYLISGTPALYARTMVALVLHHGHEVWTVEKSDAKVTVAGKRRGSSHVIEETWTKARATTAGYVKNSKYNSDPQAMLYARAAADVCRQIAPDALAGLAYTIEELEISEPEPTTTVQRSTTRRAQRAKPEPVTVQEPDLAPPTEPVEMVATEVDVRTDAQSRKMFALFREAGLEDRNDVLARVSEIVGRDVDSTKSLTKAEAARVIDALEKPVTEPPTDEPDPEVDALGNGGQS